MITTLDHLMVVVRDLETATARMADLLGRAPSWHGGHPAMGTANSLFRLDNTYLEFIAPASASGFGASLQARLEREGEGVYGLAFGSDDLDADVAALRGRGLPLGDPVEGTGRDRHTGAQRQWRNAFLPVAAGRGLLLFAIEHQSPPDALPLVAPEQHEAAVSALDHVVVHSADLDATQAIYGDGLGLRLALDKTFEGRGVRLLFYRVGGATVEVAGRLDQQPEPDQPDRSGGLAWQVPDAAAAHQRLAAAGFDLSDVRDGFKPGTRVFTVRDAPAAVPTLIIQPAARPAAATP